jgi:hypothetical protein
MQTRHAARLAAEADAATTFQSAHAVLLSPDLCSQQLWRWLDRDSKRALRGVSTALRGLVDGAIEVVASPIEGFSAPELTTALRLWHGVTHLTLLGVSSDNLQPLATATLAGLTSLTVRQVGGCMEHAWTFACFEVHACCVRGISTGLVPRCMAAHAPHAMPMPRMHTALALSRAHVCP